MTERGPISAVTMEMREVEFPDDYPALQRPELEHGRWRSISRGSYGCCIIRVTVKNEGCEPLDVLRIDRAGRQARRIRICTESKMDLEPCSVTYIRAGLPGDKESLLPGHESTRQVWGIWLQPNVLDFGTIAYTLNPGQTYHVFMVTDTGRTSLGPLKIPTHWRQPRPNPA